MRTLEEGTLDDTPFGELSLKWLWTCSKTVYVTNAYNIVRLTQ